MFHSYASVLTNLRIVIGIITLTSAVSLWQFLHEQPMPEKLLSGWSNLFSLALRKNVVKGSYRHKKRRIHLKGSLQSLPCVYWAAEG